MGSIVKATEGFMSECHMVDLLAKTIASGAVNWLQCPLIREFDYVSGRTDILCLALDNGIVALEAKLTNWRKAIHQAWRNTSFANSAYVVLPRDSADPALQHIEEFQDYGIGLCLVNEHHIEVISKSASHKPVIPWLHVKAMRSLTSNGNTLN